MRARFASTLFAALFIGAVGCGAGGAGNEGAAGADGTPGTGGVAGSGGAVMAGAAGTGVAGSSGAAGATGVAGMAGVAGTAGVAGATARGGAGGGAADASARGGAGGGVAGATARGGAGGGAAGASARGGAGGGVAGASARGGAGGGTAGVGGRGGGSGTTTVTISGRGLLVNGVPFHIKGICWNPVPKGATHPAGLDFPGAATKDIPLMRAAGINAVRTYEPLTNRAVLDALYAAGIYVLDTIYPSGGTSVATATATVHAIKDHPAILAWVIGNEWNYNGLYSNLSLADATARVKQVAAAVHAEDPAHPVATPYGELPPASQLAALPEIDLWGVNAYRGIGFGTLFQDWAARSSKPMFVSEYGADAWNANLPGEDEASQATAVQMLTQAIWDQGVAHGGSGVTVGGTLFEWADEWWKDSAGSTSAHDIGGIAPGGGPHPDATFNEEWWGVVDIDRKPRPAYDALKAIFAP